MRAVIQRVSQARVEVAGAVVGAIDLGLLVLLGVAKQDDLAAARWLADKTARLRIFPDADGKMNRSILDVGGAVLVVSQFTLLGDCRRGNRPGFDLAAPPEQARALYEHYTHFLRSHGLRVETGIFQAMMSVSLTNEGPVTILLESPSPD